MLIDKRPYDDRGSTTARAERLYMGGNSLGGALVFGADPAK